MLAIPVFYNFYTKSQTSSALTAPLLNLNTNYHHWRFCPHKRISSSKKSSVFRPLHSCLKWRDRKLPQWNYKWIAPSSRRARHPGKNQELRSLFQDTREEISNSFRNEGKMKKWNQKTEGCISFILFLISSSNWSNTRGFSDPHTECIYINIKPKSGQPIGPW